MAERIPQSLYSAQAILIEKLQLQAFASGLGCKQRLAWQG